MKRYFFMVVVLTLVLWECLGKISELRFFILPIPSEIVEAYISRFDRLFYHAQVTFVEMSVSVAAATLGAFPLVFLMFRFRRIYIVTQAFFLLFQSFPAFFVAPLLVVLFGLNYYAIIIPSVITMLFPLAMSLYRGLQAAPQEYIDYFRAHSATPRDLFLKLQLPWAMPYFFSGLRIALSLSGIGAVAGEWIGANRGLGVLIVQCRDDLDLPYAYAALFTLAILTTSFYLFGLFLERRALRCGRCI